MIKGYNMTVLESGSQATFIVYTEVICLQLPVLRLKIQRYTNIISSIR